MPLESNGVGINSRRLPAESVVSAFQHITYTTEYQIMAETVRSSLYYGIERYRAEHGLSVIY